MTLASDFYKGRMPDGHASAIFEASENPIGEHYPKSAASVAF